MMDEREALEILSQALDDVRGKGSPGRAFSPDMQITGKDGVLDSLDTMLFLERTEDIVRQRAGWDVPVAGDDMLNARPSPIATMATMAAYVVGLLDAVGSRQDGCREHGAGEMGHECAADCTCPAGDGPGRWTPR